jgi:hypothetical protein
VRPRLVLSALGAWSFVVLGVLPPASAQDRPRYGGELIFMVPSEPHSYVGH